MFDVRSSLYGATFTPHTDSLMLFFPPEGSVEVSRRHVKAKQIKLCTHAPSTRDVRAGAAVVFLGVSQEGAFVPPTTVFSKNKPERLLIKGQASVCI